MEEAYEPPPPRSPLIELLGEVRDSLALWLPLMDLAGSSEEALGILRESVACRLRRFEQEYPALDDGPAPAALAAASLAYRVALMKGAGVIPRRAARALREVTRPLASTLPRATRRGDPLAASALARVQPQRAAITRFRASLPRPARAALIAALAAVALALFLAQSAFTFTFLARFFGLARPVPELGDPGPDPPPVLPDDTPEEEPDEPPPDEPPPDPTPPDPIPPLASPLGALALRLTSPPDKPLSAVAVSHEGERVIVSSLPAQVALPVGTWSVKVSGRKQPMTVPIVEGQPAVRCWAPETNGPGAARCEE